MKLFLLACACAAQSITIKTGTLIDGKGGVQRNVVVSVEGSKIVRIEPVGAAKSTYDLSTLTLMPGWIDTHAHPNTHFDRNLTVERADVGMIQGGDGFDLAAEAVAEAFGRKFDGNFAAETRIERQEDLPHAA